MFLRRKNKKYRGIGYSYWQLCETVRTARGPRQRVVASLGKLDESEAAGLRDGWDELPALLRGEAPGPRATTTELPGIVAKETTAPRSAPQWEQADVRGLQVERTLVVPPPGNALAESDAETSPSPILQSAPRL